MSMFSFPNVPRLPERPAPHDKWAEHPTPGRPLVFTGPALALILGVAQCIVFGLCMAYLGDPHL